MNPLLPLQYCIPDVEARQWDDGRMYLYGSWDVNGDTFYCSKQYHVFSSDDFTHWLDHGRSFEVARNHSPGASRLFAPDCICRDGMYYLLYCGSDGSEGIAAAPRPEGPFGDGVALVGADGDGIDPAALVDDDGAVYYFWGQFELRGARLAPDLASIDRTTFTPQVLTEASAGFHEGASIRKRQGIYYLVYTDISRGRATSLAYATSTAPLGPYVKRGIIIDNAGCDPETWNNHGSIAEFNGQWYVFYHRSSQASRFNRRVCVEPIQFNEDGSIDEVEMTTQGASAPLDATQPVEACRACLMSGKIRSESIHPSRAGEDVREILSGIHGGDWAAYKYLRFSKGIGTFCATVGSAIGEGQIEVHCDQPDGPLLCVCGIPDTGGWRRWQTVQVALDMRVEGVHAIYLVFRGTSWRMLDLVDFSFQ
jgi:hypothetical protein